MFVQQLSLQNFRNYEHVDLSLTPGLTVIVGFNGQGKTNLIESIIFLAQGHSHRIHARDALIQQNQHAAIARVTVVHDSRALTCEAEINAQSPDRIQLNGHPVRLAEVSDALSVVLFAPEDIMLVRGEPAVRRDFVDALAVWQSPSLRGTLSDFDRTLKQRNTLLRSLGQQRGATVDLNTLDVWEESLAQLGSRIHRARSSAIMSLLPHLTQRYSELVDGDHQPVMTLDPSIFRDGAIDTHAIDSASDEQIAELYRRRLVEARKADMDRGQTSIGPHRDDVFFGLNNLPAKGYASHGETWSFVLSLRLAELDVKRKEGRRGDPIVLLDDVYAELDTLRRSRLARGLSGVEQVIVTAAIEEDVPIDVPSRMVRIDGGRIVADNMTTRSDQPLDGGTS